MKKKSKDITPVKDKYLKVNLVLLFVMIIVLALSIIERSRIGMLIGGISVILILISIQLLRGEN